MMFDPTLIVQLLQSGGVQGGAALASLSGFFLNVHTYFAEKRKHKEEATIDDYLEWLRRQNHTELVDLIRGNREAFETLFASLQTSILDAIDGLNESLERLRRELTDLDVNPSKIEISLDGWTADSGMFMPGKRQSTKLNTSLTIVNRNRTNLTLTEVSGTVHHLSNEIDVKDSGGKQAIGGDGASVTVTLITTQKRDWEQEDQITADELQLKFDQIGEPLCYKFDGAVFRFRGDI